MGIYNNYEFFYGFVSPNKKIVHKKIIYDIIAKNGNTFNEIVDDIILDSKKINKDFPSEYKNLDWYIYESSMCTLDSPPSFYTTIIYIKDVVTVNEDFVISEEILQRVKIIKELYRLSNEFNKEYRCYWEYSQRYHDDCKNQLKKFRYKDEIVDKIMELLDKLETLPPRFKQRD
jgi:hypothetical protein